MSTLALADQAPIVTSAEVTGRCHVLGILNVTPDSFSDGGRFSSVDAAVARGVDLVRQGADLVDVGGESTRPGAARVSEAEERRRVLPVVAALSGTGVPVSVDTMRASVAAAAVAAGAVLVNDVSGGLADPAMLPFLAECEVRCVLMHWRAHAATMQDFAAYGSVVEDFCIELGRRAEAALAVGVRAENIVLDPGLGFAKNSEHSWSLLAALPRLHAIGFPILLGASRKRFLADCVDYGGLDPALATDRDDVSNAISALAASAGAWGVRVHSVGPAAAAVRTASRLQAAAVRGR